MTSIAVTGSAFVRCVGLHIDGEPARSATDLTASSWSRDCHEISDVSGFSDARNDRREYGMMLSVLQFTSLPLCSFLTPE